jgi:prolyl oligopeptidase
VLVFADHMEPRPHFICDTATGAWRPFLRDEPGMFRGTVVGGRFVAITGDGAPRGRLVSIPLDTPADRETWRELVAASDVVLASVAAVGDHLVLVEFVDTYAQVRVLGLDGRVEGEIALPGRGSVGLSGGALAPIAFLDCVAVGDRREIAFVYSSLTESPTLCRADVTTLACTPLTAPAWRLDARVSDDAATSRDGTRVPYRVVARRDPAVAGPLPTVIVVYGGFNVALLPSWPGETMAAWIDAGGALALAHVRGGGEFGPAWWHAGRLAQRQRALDDLYAVAHDLVVRRITTPGRMAVHGVSHGGTLAAAAAVQRPDLFAAAVVQSPVTDQFGLVRDPITHMIARLDDGDPNDPAMSHVLLEWSPLQNVVDDVRYPAMLLDCSLNDPRCPPWHGRKLAARLQRAAASGRPVLLRLRPTAGHAAAGEAARRSRHAETLAFFAEELGLPT